MPKITACCMVKVGPVVAWVKVGITSAMMASGVITAR